MRARQKTLDPERLSRWKEWEGRCRPSSFFQTSAWGTLLARHFPFFSLEPIESERFFLPLVRHRRWGGLSDSLYGMPLMTPGGVLREKSWTPVDWDRVARALKTKSVGSLAICFPPGEEPPPLTGFQRETGSTHVLDLAPGFDSLWSRYDRHCRTEVRKAIKLGVEVRECKSEEAVQSHWNLVSAEFGKWRPDPCPTFDFIQEAIALSESRLFQAVRDQRVVVSLLAFGVPSEIFFWQGARVAEDYPKGSNNLLFSEVIRKSAEEGTDRVNFGGSLGNRSIERFKEDFGARPTPFSILKYVHPWIRFARSLFGRF